MHFTVANALLNSIPVTNLTNPDQYEESDRSSGRSGRGGRRRGLAVLEGDLYAPLTATADATTAAATGAGAAGHGQERFTAVLANPPFVAVPSGLADLPLHAAWALFAAGGPAGDEVLRRIVEGAADYLEPTVGWLGIVTEIPNVKQTGAWLVPLLSSARTPAEQAGDADNTDNEILPPAGRATGSGGSGGGGDRDDDSDDDANSRVRSMVWESAVVFGAGCGKRLFGAIVVPKAIDFTQTDSGQTQETLRRQAFLAGTWSALRTTQQSERRSEAGRVGVRRRGRGNAGWKTTRLMI